MKIVLDLRKYDGVVGGVEQGALQLAKSMPKRGNEVLLVCKESRKDELQGILGDIDGLKLVPIDIESHSISAANKALDSGFFQELAKKEGADLIHFFYNWSFPENKAVPCLLTIHDVIPFTFREAMALWRNLFLYKPAMRKACKLNDMIATVSEFSRQDIAKTVGVPLEKIKVVYNGLRNPAPFDQSEFDRLISQFGLEKGFILNAGGIHERKNIPRLVLAFGKLVKEGYPGKLIITGKASGAPYQEKMRILCDRAVAEAGLQKRVIFAGFIPDEDLDTLLHKADVFIYPSMYEGFGIPIIEAMKLETPVVTSTVTAMPEVAGDAALLADPENVDEMASQMDRILKDDKLRSELVAKGVARASGFSWDRNCEEYISTYEEMISR